MIMMTDPVRYDSPVSHYLEQCRAAMRQVVGFLGGTPGNNASLAELYAAYEERRQTLGSWKMIGVALGVPEKHADEVVNKCNMSLRHVRTLESQLAEAAPPTPTQNHELILLRALNQLERLTENKPDIGLQVSLPEPDNRKLVRSQQEVRALELVIRSLIGNSYGSQENLRDELTTWLGSEQVQKWLSTSDNGDLLSGTSFGELAGLFINKKQYPVRYDRFYKDTRYLQLLDSQRATLADFLEDIRVIRNQIAHHKRISAVQVALLSSYYDEVISPVQQAYDRSGEGVNPDRYFDVDSAELEVYFDDVRKRLDSLGDQMVSLLGDMREIDRKLTEVHGTVNEVKGTVEDTNNRVIHMGAEAKDTRGQVIRIGNETEGSRKRLKQVLAGISLLAVVSIATLYLSTGAKKETSADPRKELANRGLTWRPEELRGVIENGDVESARLYLDGGMKWNSRYAYKSLDRDDKPMLALLEDYPTLLTNEADECGALMSHLTRTEPGTQRSDDRGRSAQPHRLTSAERTMLKLVCSKPEDIKKAQDEADRAAAFYRSQMEAYNKEKAAIKPAAQCIAELSADNHRSLLEEVSSFNIMRVSMTLTRREELLSTLYPEMLTGRLSKESVTRAVSKYCTDQAAEEPNIDISEAHSLSKKQILDELH